jgi:hypothetical protein
MLSSGRVGLGFGALLLGAAFALPAGAAECRGLELQTYERDRSGALVLVEASCRTGKELLPWFDAPTDLPQPPDSGGTVIHFREEPLDVLDAAPIEELVPEIQIRDR